MFSQGKLLCAKKLHKINVHIQKRFCAVAKKAEIM